MSGPRFSITPARFVEDDRAGLSHHRVLGAMGRHAKADGWLRVKQGTLGTAINLSRQTVNSVLADLVAWGYVEKRETDATGRAIYYRIMFDNVPPPAVDDGADDFAPAVDNPASAMPTCQAALTGPAADLSSALDTRCKPLGLTPGVGPVPTQNDYSLTPTSNDTLPLPPPSPAPPPPRPRQTAARRAPGRSVPRRSWRLWQR